MHDFDMCLVETYLTSTKDINDKNLKMPGYIMYCVDHPSDVKRGGACIYYKTMLSLKVYQQIFFRNALILKYLLETKKMLIHSSL